MPRYISGFMLFSTRPYSANAQEVYSALNYTVAKVEVEIGDVVAEGDILAVLDTTGLEYDISQKQAAVWSSQQTAQHNVVVAQHDLEVYEKNIENNYDSNLINSESTLTTSTLDIQSAEADLEIAGNDLQSARRELRDARNDEGNYEEISAADGDIQKLKDSVFAKESAYEKATINLEKAKENSQKAEQSLAASESETTDNIANYENKVKSAQLNNNYNDQYIAIERLQTDLEDCTILSPTSGTITSVNAVEGQASSGSLFTIQDTKNLKVVTNVKEYDLPKISIGNKAEIKTDATGEEIFQGKISKIAITSTLTKTSENNNSTDAEYEVEIEMSSAKSGLFIGMNTRVNIITEDKKDVFAVPYEAILTEADGKSYILKAILDEKSNVTYNKIEVTKGIQSNIYVEVSGVNLAVGVEFAKSAKNVLADETANGGKK